MGKVLNLNGIFKVWGCVSTNIHLRTRTTFLRKGFLVGFFLILLVPSFISITSSSPSESVLSPQNSSLLPNDRSIRDPALKVASEEENIEF
jgi:hypothetical protein